MVKKDRDAPAMITPLGRLIQAKMDSERWTQSDVARRGMTRPTLSLLLSRRTPYKNGPREATLAEISKTMGIPMSTLREATIRSTVNYVETDRSGPAWVESTASEVKRTGKQKAAERARLQRMLAELDQDDSL